MPYIISVGFVIAHLTLIENEICEKKKLISKPLIFKKSYWIQEKVVNPS